MKIDFHTHAFPDKLAAKAIPALEKEGDIKAELDGTVSSLITSMDNAGIDVSVVASIATKPSQTDAITEWSLRIRSERVIPFPSVYPGSPGCTEKLGEIARMGFKGIKLHPYYQNFVVDDKSFFPLYEAAAEAGLIILFHTGFDIAFPKERIAGPARFSRIHSRFPDLKMVLSHFGGWEDWEEAEKHLYGKPVYLDTSYSLGRIPERILKKLLQNHPEGYILFGSDSPWGNQTEEIQNISALPLDSKQQESILGGAAASLLRMPG
ncbi:MAG: amidohydrolase family protein [Spirochaetia bacterium]